MDKYYINKLINTIIFLILSGIIIYVSYKYLLPLLIFAIGFTGR